MKNSVYIESSVISYLTAKPCNDLVQSGRQAVTIDWWKHLSQKFDLYVSVLVIDEISSGDSKAAEMRIATIENIPILGINEKAIAIAEALISSSALPTKAKEDAVHIGIAASQGVDYLLTWNFKHINNAHKKSLVKSIVEDFKLECPVLCSPEELGEYYD